MKFKKIITAVLSLVICCNFLMPYFEMNDTSFSVNVSAESTGAYSGNLSGHNYATYGVLVNSYLYEDTDSSLVRFESIDDGIIIEKYSDYTNVEKTFSIDKELQFFCGFYAGSDANYVVFGAENIAELNDKEVLRVVKYSKDWERLSACSIKGANTYFPCYSGSLDMTEENGSLVIHTCHKMYKSSDGLNHQANMTFVIDEKTMECTDSFTGVMNIAQAGYVSHSFMQYVDTDGEYIYRVDHGDAYPRGITITKAKSSSITDVDYTMVYNFSGNIGDNETNAFVGGLSVMKDTCLVAFATYDQQSDSSDTTYNICLSVVNKDMSGSNLINLTNYNADDGVDVTNPYIIKYDDDKSLAIWEEYSGNGYIGTRLCTVDGNGNIIESAINSDFRLSDCKPILTSDGYIKWYVTNNSSPCFYMVNPDNLSKIENDIKGDLDEDNEITSNDALIILKSITDSITLNSVQNKNADVNGDGEITSLDALIVLQQIVGI